MKNVAIIPARAGSKGLIGKNLKVLCGKTLVHRALAFAAECGFDKIILSTDIPVLLEEPPRGWVVRHRPSELCTDASPMAHTVIDALNWADIRGSELVWLFQPTSPFRIKRDVEEILTIFWGTPKVKSVLSVTPSGDHHPSHFYTLNGDGSVISTDPKAEKSIYTNRQSLKPSFERNGLYYVARASDLHQSGGLWNIHPRFPFVINERRATVNINDEIDLEYAKWVASKWM